MDRCVKDCLREQAQCVPSLGRQIDNCPQTRRRFRGARPEQFLTSPQGPPHVSKLCTPPENKRPALSMSNSWPDPDFARVSAASGSASPGPQVSQQAGVTHMPEEDANPDEEQETHRIDMAAWLKPPDTWILVYDFQLRSPYYHNIMTGKSQWTLPTESWEEQ